MENDAFTSQPGRKAPLFERTQRCEMGLRNMFTQIFVGIANINQSGALLNVAMSEFTAAFLMK